MDLRLTLDVRYTPNGVSKEELKENLEQLVVIAKGDALLTRDSEAEVEGLQYRVIEVAASHWDNDPDYPLEDWRHEIADDNTRQSYSDWVASQKEDADVG